MKIQALLIAAALASPAAAQSSDDLWQMLVDAEIALTIEEDGPRAEQLLENVGVAMTNVAPADRPKLEVRLAKLRGDLEALRAGAPDGDQMSEFVLNALNSQHGLNIFRTSGDAGGRALAELLQARTLDDDPGDRATAEQWLATWHPTRSIALASDLVKRGAAGDFEQAARLASHHMKGTWTAGSTGFTRRWADPRWHDLLVDLLSDPRLASNVSAHEIIASVVVDVISGDAVTPAFAEAVMVAHETMPAQRAQLHGRSIVARARTLEPVYVALLDIGHPDERRFAAARLADFDDPSALLPYAADEDTTIRREVARSLTARKVSGQKIAGRVGNAQIPALKALTADDDDGVRTMAVKAAASSPGVLTKERWMGLARDAELDVQIAVTEYPFAHRWADDVLSTLAASKDVSIATLLDGRLVTALGRQDIPFGLVLKRLDHSSLPMSSIGVMTTDQAAIAFQTRTTHLFSWLIEQDTNTLQRVMTLARHNIGETLGRGDGLTTDEHVQLQHAFWRATDGALDIKNLDDNGPVSTKLAFDGSLPWDWRWKVIPPYACSSADAEALFNEILSDPAALAAENATDDRIRALIRKHSSHNVAFLNAWKEGVLPKHKRLRSLLYVEAENAGAQELAEKVLALGNETPKQAWSTAVVALAHEGTVSDADVNAYLLDPSDRDGANHEVVLGHIERQKDMTRFPAIRTLLEGESIADGRAYGLTFVLADIGSPSALDLLLVGAASAPSRSIRAQCLAQAREVQKHLDALERFTSGAEAPSAENAAAELLAMLDDTSPMIRAEAARSLATLGAVEHLPRLVRMLRDEDKTVREAVREALDRLHATASADS